MKKAFIYLFIGACVILTGNYFYKPASAQQTQQSIDTNDSIDAERMALAAKFDRLIEKTRVRNDGKMRVIVGVKIEFKPEGDLSKNAAEQQRVSIKNAQNNLLEKLQQRNVSAVKNFEFVPFVVMEVDVDTLAALKELSDVASIEEDQIMAPTLERSTGVIGAPQAWSAGFSGASRTVAVLDTGVDKNHPFFGGRVVSEGCYSTTNPADGATSNCPGGASSSTAPNSGMHCDVNLSESCEHGTHVAGIVGGRNNSLGRYGVARDANLIAIQVFSMFTGENCGDNPNCALSYTSDQIRGLERVYALRNTYTIDAVNVSIGGGKYTSNCDSEMPAYKAAIDNLRSANIATIIASGNSGHTDGIAGPACISSAISVGSTHDGDAGTEDAISSFSNSSSILTILAPGQLITSSIPNGQYNATQGTSMAAPHVAGAWAVLKQKFPTETVSQILDRFISTGKNVTDSRNNITKKRIRLDYAVGNPAPDPCGAGTPIAFNQPVSNALMSGDCVVNNRYRDRYTFSGVAGQQIAILMESFSIDTYLYLYDNNGNEIAFNDDYPGGAGDARIPSTGVFTLPSSGTFTIGATSYNMFSNGGYTLTLTGTAPICNYSVNPGSANVTANAGVSSMSVAVSAPNGCVWSAVSNNTNWLLVESGTNGSGNGTFKFFTHANTSAASRTGTITVGGQNFTVTQSGATLQTPSARTQFDFDGDGKADASVFRSANGAWYLNQSQNGFTGVTFGQNGDKIVPADYDGDGKTDVAVFRNGTWYLNRTQFGFTGVAFGVATDIPVPADYDGDGKADVAVFRPSTGTWYLNQSQNGFTGVAFGQNGDRPVAADYDGDGKTDVAVYRNGTWFINRSQLGFTGVSFGEANDKAVPADFDGDGKADVAVYRPSTGSWYLNRSQAGFTGVNFGIASDIPVPADYDGDGKADVAVFRAGTWYLNRSQAGFTGIAFGAATDNPANGAFVR